jgi:1-acyl-sn-glycerol-3-phosphate acyltransferase
VVLGIVRLILFGVDTAIAVPAALAASLADSEAKLSYHVAQWWAWAGVKICGSTVHVDGLEHLDPTRSYVFMSNHRSNVDVLALVEALWDFQLRWVAKEELAKIPWFGWALRATKHIIINRADHAQAVASLAAAERRMGTGISVVFFPEGTRGTDQMLPFKKGGFIFAIETKTAIVPIAIIGTDRILPKGHWLCRQGGDVRVSVQPPISTVGLSLDDRDALMAAVRSAIESGLERAAAVPERAAAAKTPAFDARRPRPLHGAPLPSGARR